MFVVAKISLKSDGLVWIDELYQYSPAQDVIASDGKRFQHMVGADIRRASGTTAFTVKTGEEGKDDPGKAEGKDDPGKNESGSENGGKTAKTTSQKSESSNPDTGDASGLALWIVVLAGAGAGAAVLIRRKLSCPTDM